MLETIRSLRPSGRTRNRPYTLFIEAIQNTAGVLRLRPHLVHDQLFGVILRGIQRVLWPGCLLIKISFQEEQSQRQVHVSTAFKKTALMTRSIAKTTTVIYITLELQVRVGQYVSPIDLSGFLIES